MTQEPELPGFVRDLEILESLDRLEPPMVELAAETTNSEHLESSQSDVDGLPS